MEHYGVLTLEILYEALGGWNDMELTSQTGAVMSCTSSVANLDGGRIPELRGTPAGQATPQLF